jgi:hypothetical protein
MRIAAFLFLAVADTLPAQTIDDGVMLNKHQALNDSVDCERSPGRLSFARRPLADLQWRAGR